MRLWFVVGCWAAPAFRVWTSRMSTWWPPDHTVTGHPERVVLQGDVGGRIYERTADGAEHDWGEVTVWQPPSRLAYLWHLGIDRAIATEVDIRFVARGETATRIEIEHRGWERLGDAASSWREQNVAGWQSLLPHFRAAAEKSATEKGKPDG
ncbi:MAG: SRPBCC domain-containing protein [Streptosporangiaceae bacterium]